MHFLRTHFLLICNMVCIPESLCTQTLLSSYTGQFIPPKQTIQTQEKHPKNDLQKQLFTAIRSESHSDILYCLQNGAYLAKTEQPNRNDPILIATRGGSHSVLHLLLQYGGTPNGASRMVHPLTEAVSYNNYSLARLLVTYGANPDAQDMIEKALHWAAINNNIQITRLLLRHGARPNANNKLRQTPSERTRSNNHSIQQLLNKAVQMYTKTLPANCFTMTLQEHQVKDYLLLALGQKRYDFARYISAKPHISAKTRAAGLLHAIELSKNAENPAPELLQYIHEQEESHIIQELLHRVTKKVPRHTVSLPAFSKICNTYDLQGKHIPVLTRHTVYPEIWPFYMVYTDARGSGQKHALLHAAHTKKLTDTDIICSHL